MAKTTSPKKTAAKKPKPAAGKFTARVHVRMYCHGLGDCFLLRFETKKGSFVNVLIDCGIYKASPGAGDIMQTVAADVVNTTKTAKDKNGHLHLLVVTHEHWDHISGFAQALKQFQAMRVDQVWQAWTEDETDPKANELLAKYKRVKARLVAALRRADAAPRVGATPPALAEAFEVMGFFGVDRLGGAKADQDADDAYDTIKKLLAAKHPTYHSPGEVLAVGDTGVQAFVLGPPKDVKAIGKDDPGSQDGYHKQATGFFDGMASVLGAIKAGDAGDGAADAGRPFDLSRGIPAADAARSDYFRQAYAFGDPNHPEAFRSIDDLAAESLGHLALRLDSHLNNTSLVLAFKLPSGRVLLFPGDAQAGNWKSWAGLDKPLEFPNATPPTDAHQLLRNTVFYKVSHHGSHNATPRTYGLELMTHSDLRAVVPVDHEIAAGAGYGEMPLVEIMAQLTARTRGAVVRSDEVGTAPKPFTVSKETLTLRTRKDGQEITRPLYCETAFDLSK